MDERGFKELLKKEKEKNTPEADQIKNVIEKMKFLPEQVSVLY